jgi:hypothetical protein
MFKYLDMLCFNLVGTIACCVIRSCNEDQNSFSCCKGVLIFDTWSSF